MCGIAGVLNQHSSDASRLVSGMIGAIRYRGPDDSGVWCDPSAGFGLGHARLSILDLTPTGHQPMESATGRYVIAFNGEIYNHLELREALGAVSWRGRSDTETILAGVEAWGVEKTLKSLIGMFAIALWDRMERRLVLTRDRLGEKPLYYGWCGDVLLFGSELKALRAHPAWRCDVDRDALVSYMRYGYVPLPFSIYRGIRKLLPGTMVTLSGKDPAGTFPQPSVYWSARDTASRTACSDLTDEAAVSELDILLRKAVARQMVADVPLGAFLSGGVDSSAVVAVMQTQSSRPVRTFSLGFSEEDYDEARHAKAVAEHLRTDHTEFYVKPEDALAVIPRLPEIYDEPFADSSQIPTHLVAKLARHHVTVSLSGDGGDELFGGYNRYFWGRSIWGRVGPLPVGLRRWIGSALALVSPEKWDTAAGTMRALWHGRRRLSAVGDKVHKLAGVIDAENPAELYRRLVSQQWEPGSVVIGGSEPTIWADTQCTLLDRQDFSERMMFHDLVGYLTDDILAKVDRAAMAVSLETRVPFLDHQVVEFAWRLPLCMRIRQGQGKWLLRQVLYRYVPRTLIERPKMGFGIPLDSWLRGPLREWAEDLLDEGRLRREGYLNPTPIREKWAEHLSGRRNWQYWLWNVLMFQAWAHR